VVSQEFLGPRYDIDGGMHTGGSLGAFIENPQTAVCATGTLRQRDRQLKEKGSHPKLWMRPARVR